MDARRGGEVVFKEFVLPYLRASYEDLSAAMNGADLLVSHPITLAGPLIGRKMGRPWISTVLSPLSMFSVSDPPVWPTLPARERFARMGAFLNRGFMRFADWVTRPWFKDYRQLERELGLPAGPSPMFDGHHSPYRVQALFSSALATPQPDWPPQTCVTGFPFFDRDERGGIPPELERFLADVHRPSCSRLALPPCTMPETFSPKASRPCRSSVAAPCWSPDARRATSCLNPCRPGSQRSITCHFPRFFRRRRHRAPGRHWNHRARDAGRSSYAGNALQP
jgi:rhamnosyltransferase subunit B